MFGLLVFLVSVVGSVFFSFFLFLSNSLVVSWLCLELSTLCLVPSFFMTGSAYCFSALFSYLIVSGISSGLIIYGLLFPSFSFMIFLGFYIKFGLFPFVGWVYDVSVNSNWLVVYILGVVLKSSILILCFFIGGLAFLDLYYLVFCIGCIVTLTFLSVFFWFYSYSWFHCWCHMMLSSSSVLLLMSVVLSVDSILILYLSYFVWGSFTLYFLYWGCVNYNINSILFYCLYALFLLTTPLSVSLLYKFSVCLCMFSCSFYCLIVWVLYNVSEQLYLLKYISSCYSPKSFYVDSLYV